MINPLGVMVLCLTAPIMKVPTENFAIAEIVSGGRYRIEFADREYYIAVSNTTKKVFDHEYYGVAVAVRSKEDAQNEHVKLQQMLVSGEALVIDNRSVPKVDAYGMLRDVYWMIDDKEVVWIQYRDKNSNTKERSPSVFNAMWEEYLLENIKLDIDQGKIVF